MGSKLILSLTLSLIFGNLLTEATICDTVTTCSHFKHVQISGFPENVSSRWENEPEIAKTGSWEGVVPESYRLHLNFLNRTHYSGILNIYFHLRQSTNRILINHGTNSPSVDYKSIMIGRVCNSTKLGSSSDTRRSNAANTSQCIHTATFFEFNETLLLELTGLLKATPGTRYKISFPKFEGTSGAAGLRESTSKREPIPYYFALSTIFQMRHARTVFPCFDQPSLKARFDLSITRPSTMDVANNTRSMISQRVDTDRRVDRFLPTPAISTYLFTFALMENYTSETMSVPGGGTKIEILAPTGKMDRLRWMLPEAVRTVQYFERITRVKFPLDRLAFLVLYPAPFSGVENFGLVTVEGKQMQYVKSETAYLILYHEIAHQWLGDVVTISEWKEICLQEGLTTYFQWYLSAQPRSVDETARSVSWENNYVRYYEPYALLEYDENNHITERCFGLPPLFFHPLAKRFGFQAMENFLAKLIEKKPYGTADIRLWDTTMEEVTRSGTTRMTGYIEGWFLGPGTVHLLVSMNATSRCVLIRQAVAVAQEKGGLETPTRPRPLPFNVTIANTTSQSTVTVDGFLHSLEEHVCEENGDATVVVDVDGDTFTRKAYTAELYKRVFETQNDSQVGISKEQMVSFVKDFCTVLLDDILPISEEPPSTKPAEWLHIYDTVKKLSALAGPIWFRSVCSACLRSKEELDEMPSFKPMWNSNCKELRLTKLVGRNYAFPGYDM